MTEQEYMEMLDKLRVLIKSGRAEEALPFLDEMFELKPVRLKWSLVRAEALSALGRWDEGAAELFDICWFHYTDDETHAYLQWYRSWRKHLGDSLGEASCRYLQAVIDARLATAKPDPFIARTDTVVSDCEQRFLSSPDDAQTALALANAYYVANRHIEWAVMRELLCELHPAEVENCPGDTVFPRPSLNRDYIVERLAERNHTFSVCARDDGELQTATVLAGAIKRLGHRSILLTPPLEYETDGSVKTSDTVQISADNLEERDGVIYCHPIRVLGNNGAADNHAPLLAELSGLTEDGLMFLLSTSDAMDAFFMQPELRKLSERLTVLEMDEFSSHFNFGYVGRYTTYVSYIYGFDVAAELSKPSACAISIIVPARNSADTLRHTLRTCLEQTFDDYEVVVSDNSVEGNTAVRELVDELDDPKIKYYKTPRGLGLAKSFEFAFLKANGDFLFSIGADDAVLPWGLETIDKVLRDKPGDDLLQWDRGFYIWPDFVAKHQLGQFSIPRSYIKGKYDVQRYKGLEMVLRVMKQPEVMYVLPMLYINSGCRRRYLKKLLDKSGRLWAGTSQDIYMGVANCVINREVLSIAYPITLAGMSGASIGGSSVTGARNKIQLAYNAEARYWYPMPTVLERELTAGGGIPGDRQLVYNSVSRAAAFGILPDTIREQFDWDEVYDNCFAQLLKVHPAYDRITTASAKYPYAEKEFGKHFGDKFLREMMKPGVEVETPEGSKCYGEGFGGDGGLTLDSRKFGITNIHEAVELFKNITNL